MPSVIVRPLEEEAEKNKEQKAAVPDRESKKER